VAGTRGGSTWGTTPSLLPAFIDNSISQSKRNWTDGPVKTKQEKILKDHWVMLGCLRGDGVTVSTVIGQYYACGVVPLRRRPLRLCEMTADRAPWAGTVTAPTVPSPLEIQCCMAQAIGKASYSWPLTRLISMPPHKGTEKLVNHCLIDEFWLIFRSSL
jgi:hypothetical protein